MPELMIIWLQTEVATDLGTGDGKAEGVLASGGKLDGLHLRHVLVLGDGDLNLDRGGGSHGIGVAESSISESMVSKSGVAKTMVSEAGVSESVGQDGGNSRGSLSGFLISGSLPAGLALLQAGDLVAEGVYASGLMGGVLDDRHGHLNLVHHGLGHGVGVAGIAKAMVAEATIGQTPVGQNNLEQEN